MSLFKKTFKFRFFISVMSLIVFMFYAVFPMTSKTVGVSSRILTTNHYNKVLNPGLINIISISDTDVCRQPQANLAFIRTHKTASSTLMHMFLRFADKYQRLLVYSKSYFDFDYKEFNRSRLLGLKPEYNYNIFAEHAIFNYEEMRAVMPDDTKYITILRDPVAQFESLYNYMFMELNNGMNISTFANLNTSDPEKFKVVRNRVHGVRGIHGVNENAFDLGIDPTIFDDECAISEKIQELDRQFDLVMITELFDESLILMKKKLCWIDTNDVIAFKDNARKDGKKVNLSSEQKENLRRMNRADQMIYDHFYEKLLRQIDAFGKEKMEEEVEKLRKTTKEIYDFCVDEEAESEKLDEIVRLKLKKEAESHKVCRELTRSYFHLYADIFTKQKSLFAENKLWLDWFEISMHSSSFLYSTLRNIQSFLLRNTIR